MRYFTLGSEPLLRLDVEERLVPMSKLSKSLVTEPASPMYQSAATTEKAACNLWPAKSKDAWLRRLKGEV